MKKTTHRSAGPAGRGQLLLQVATGLILIWTCWALAQAWIARHHRRWVLPASPAIRLSPQSSQVLADLRQPVEIWAFSSGDWPFRRHLRDLLDLVRYSSASVTVTWVDPWLDPARAAELGQRLGVREGVVLVVQSGERQERVLDTAMVRELSGGAHSPIDMFEGEGPLLQAILAVTDSRPARVAFVTGHDERAIDDYTPGRGLSDFARALRRQAIDLLQAPMAEIATGPDAAALIVISAPSRPWTADELERLRAYLAAGGRGLVLAEAGFPQELAGWLQEWDLQIAGEALKPPQEPLAEFLETSSLVRLTRYPAHPVTASLQGLQTSFYGVRPIIVLNAQDPTDVRAGGGLERDRPHILLTAPPGSRRAASPNNPATDDARQEPIAFGAAVERGRIPGVDAGSGHLRRLVVIGDCDFLANGRLGGGNLDLGLNAVNWLLGREALLSGRSIQSGQPLAPLSSRQQAQLLARGILAPIVFVLALGLLVGVLRR